MKNWLLLFMFTSNVSFAQQKEMFTLDAFINQVKQFHPLAKQASMQVDKAKADLLAAKGGFDPTINLEASRKTFDGKNYYYYNNPELKIPLPVGDIKTGIENNGGSNISSELTPGNSSYLGMELPLAKGLFIDKRRATLQQAKIYVNQSEQEKLKMLNDLLFDAYTAYWQWAGSYQLFSIYSKYVQISNDRLRLVRIAQANGDRALVDTVEAYTQVQNFQLLQTDALLKLNNTSLELSNFLWINNDTAYLLPTTLVPDTVQFASNTTTPPLEELISKIATQNPTLASYNYKLDALEVERKLKQQSLLPTVNAKANLLSKDYYTFKTNNAPYLENNYKWGIDFKMPIFLREGRGEYKKAQLKIKETNLEVSNKRWEIEIKIRSYYNENALLQQQVQLATAAYNNFITLLKTENLRFVNGESSLFLVNSRENKVIETLQKITELRMKLFKAKYAVEWAAGLLR
jgi:outer membrane protein TolC